MAIRTPIILTASSLLALAACIQQARYVPSSPANVVAGSPHTASASARGINLDVRVNSWSGDPADLEDILTPVKLTIRNEGEHALSVRYRDFSLSNPQGIRSSALPPFRIHGYASEPAPVIVPAFAYSNFFVYPNYGFYGPGLGFWRDDWGWNGGWYGTYYGYWQQSLPTADMLRKAIPEGVVNSGGSVDGYLYFQKVPKDARELQFDASLMDAQTHRSIATIHVPFERENR